jgi:hypothetical protein
MHNMLLPRVQVQWFMVIETTAEMSVNRLPLSNFDFYLSIHLAVSFQNGSAEANNVNNQLFLALVGARSRNEQEVNFV